MALKDIFQQAIQLNKLYKVNRKPVPSGESEQLTSSLFINSGTVKVYGYNGATEPTALSDMVLNNDNTDVFGLVPFSAIPTYIAIEQQSGTTTEIVASGLQIEEIGDIA